MKIEKAPFAPCEHCGTTLLMAWEPLDQGWPHGTPERPCIPATAP